MLLCALVKQADSITESSLDGRQGVAGGCSARKCVRPQVAHCVHCTTLYKVAIPAQGRAASSANQAPRFYWIPAKKHASHPSRCRGCLARYRVSYDVCPAMARGSAGRPLLPQSRQAFSHNNPFSCRSGYWGLDALVPHPWSRGSESNLYLILFPSLQNLIIFAVFRLLTMQPHRTWQHIRLILPHL